LSIALEDLFSSAGHVIRANVITKAATGVFGRLFGFVQYASADEATRAIAQYDGKRMGDAALHVRFGNSNRVIKRRRLYMKNLPQGVDVCMPYFAYRGTLLTILL